MTSEHESEDEVITLEDDRPADPWKLHCVATWHIRNFGFCQLDCGEEIFSPLLSTDATGKVKWCLSIFPNGQTGHEGRLSVSVAFMQSGNETIDRFQASCKVSILNSESNEWLSRRVDGRLPRFQFDDLVEREKLLAERDAMLSGHTLLLRCHVAAIDPTTSLNVKLEEGDEHQRMLVHDFKKLYEGHQLCDVTLETRDGELRVHRAVLSARAPAIVDMLQNRTSLPLSDIDRKAANSLMTYLYCGHMEATGMLDLCELARTFRLPDLTAALHPNQVTIRTQLTHEVFQYTCRFRDPGAEPRIRLQSDIFHSGPPSRAWYLSLCCRTIPGDENDRYLSVHLHKPWSSRYDKAVFVRFKVSVLDGDQCPVHTRESSATFRQVERHGFPDFIRRSAVLPHLYGGVLTLHCEMRLSDGSSSSGVEHSFRSRHLITTDQGALLSVCFGELLRDGRDSDVTVFSNRRSFRLHKAVLCARSPVFADFFERNRNVTGKCAVNVWGIRPPVLNLLFSYLYTGVTEVDALSAPELLAAANYYQVSGLQRLCSDFMASRIREVAVGSKTIELVKDFVCSNAERVLISEQWAELVRDHPRLATNILAALSRGYLEAKRKRHE